MKTFRKLAATAASAAALALGAALLASGPAQAAGTLKIGVLGVMSGPAASWGLVNRYCAEVTAKMYNDMGGVEIGGEKYMIEVSSIDDKNDPKLSINGAKKHTGEGIRYIIGPNVDTTAQAIVPVLEEAGAMNFPYAFARELYTPPRSNSVLGMIASYQAGPVIYKRLMADSGITSIAFVARNESDPLNQRVQGVAAANMLGLEVLASEDTYEPGTTDFFPVMSRIVQLNPDLIVLSGAAPSDAPLLIKSARELGYGGLLSTETAQDAKILSEVAGDAANGFISVGGASTPEISDDYMNAFREAYVAHVGEWNDEAGTKVYALEVIIETLKLAGKAAIDDIEAFKAAMPNLEVENRLLKGENSLGYVGTGFFEQPRQLPIPMVVNEYRDGGFRTLFVGSVE